MFDRWSRSRSRGVSRGRRRSNAFVSWSWHGINLGDMRNDLVEVRVATHLGNVSDDVRGDVNVSQSPTDSRCSPAILL